MSTLPIGVAILAAGASSRMGRSKMLLPWGNTTVLGHLVAQWREVSVAPIAVVYAKGDAALEAELDRLAVPFEQRILNPEPARGMFSSIQCAASHDWADARHVGIVLGDQPHLSIHTLRTIAQFAAANPGCICQPSRVARPRHPVFLPRDILQSAARTEAETATLKSFLAGQIADRKLLEIEDAGLDCDVDTPADYESARQRFGNRK